MQLFTHLLSCYLQGMEDFFSALPRGRSSTKGPSKTLQAPSQPSPRGRSSTTGPSKTLLPHPNHYTPHPSLPKEEGESSNRLKHSRKKLPPFGEGWGGASGGMAGCVDRIIILPFFGHSCISPWQYNHVIQRS